MVDVSSGQNLNTLYPKMVMGTRLSSMHRITQDMGYRFRAYTSEPDFVSRVQEAMKQISLNLASVLRQVVGATPEIILEALEPTFEKSKYYVPKKTEALLRSAFMRVEGTPAGVKVVMGYAAEGDPYYAIYVHEQVGYFHPLPTRAKFLTRAFDEDMEQIRERLVAGYRRLTGG